MVLKNRGKYLRYYCCITLSSSRKTNASSRHSTGSTATSSWGGGARCRAETLTATVDASTRPLAMVEGRKKPRWKEANGKRLRGVVPPPPLLIKGRDRGSVVSLNQPGSLRWQQARPSTGLLAQLKVHGYRTMHAPSHNPYTCHLPRAMHAPYVAQGLGIVGKVEQRFQGEESK